MSKMTQLTVRDDKGNPDLIIELEWGNRKGAKFVKAKVGEHTAWWLAKDLWAVAFAIADEEAQEKMIPSKLMEVRKISKMVRVKAKNDIKAGEEITFKVGFDLTPMDINGEHPPTTGGYAEEI